VRQFKDDFLRAAREPLKDREAGLECLGPVCSDAEAAAHLARYEAAIERKALERSAQNKKAAGV
jgi:hypothetical protein